MKSKTKDADDRKAVAKFSKQFLNDRQQVNADTFIKALKERFKKRFNIETLDFKLVVIEAFKNHLAAFDKGCDEKEEYEVLDLLNAWGRANTGKPVPTIKTKAEKAKDAEVRALREQQWKKESEAAWERNTKAGYEYDPDQQEWYKPMSSLSDNEQCRILAEGMGSEY